MSTKKRDTPVIHRGQTVEKPMVLERAAFLASFGRSQRSRKMLRHKALGLCPKPRQARREACALWALGPKAQSDPKRGSETMSAPEGSVSPVGCCAQRKATRRREQIQGLRAASAQNADICEGSETMRATVRECA